MDTKHFKKAGILCVLLLVAFIGGWEWYCRSNGYDTFYDDTDALWADKRAMVYKEADKATVFIGSSRIKFDLDIPTWEALTGTKAVQLAMVGSTPVPVLHDLAADENFKGRLVIDVTEPLFFSAAPPNIATPNQNIGYYKKRTPTQRFSFEVNRGVEGSFAFLNQEYLSLRALLGQAPLPQRAGVFHFPYFPPGFERTNIDRQSIMSDAFVNDTNQHQKMQQNWLFLIEASKQFPMPPKEALEATFASVKTAVDKIRARGGQVIFVRTPASGPMWQGEQMGFPREQYWDKLLALTNAPGIHFTDYNETSHFICPEWSHLTPQHAVVYTEHLVRQLEGKGWQFAGTPHSKLTTKL